MQAEQANSLELGAKWNRTVQDWALAGAVQAYHQRVNNAIAQVPGPADGIFMDNVEGLKMSGLEGSMRVLGSIGNAVKLDINGWLNVNRHAFDPYASTLPGTPLHIAGATGSLSKSSWVWRWQYQWFDRIKLHNTFDDWAEPQHRLNSSIQFNRDQHALQLGVRNVLDAEFSGWLQTNAFGGRYFNPAPTRSIWVSWRWKLTR